MNLSEGECWRRLSSARCAQLSTVASDGRPHAVPFVFALLDDSIVHAVDHKPKRRRDLVRLRNIETNAAVAVLVHHYSDTWEELWWVRVDGTARIVESGAEFTDAVAALQARYAQYQEHPPEGPVIVVDVARISGWAYHAD